MSFELPYFLLLNAPFLPSVSLLTTNASAFFLTTVYFLFFFSFCSYQIYLFFMRDIFGCFCTPFYVFFFAIFQFF